MTDSTFRNIFLPALLASSTTFAVLTLPVASPQSDHIMEKWPTPIQQWLSFSHTYPEPGLTIRYIGFAILSSTAVGIGLSELLHAKQAKALRDRALLREACKSYPDDTLEVPLEKHIYPAEADSLSSADAETDGETATTAASPNANNQTQMQITELDWDVLRTPPMADFDAQGSRAEFAPRILAGSPDTCCIRTSDHQRLTAIAVDGEFYSFYRFGKDPDKLPFIQDKLRSVGKTTVATCEPDGYILWLHRPGAELVSPTWQSALHLGSGATSTVSF